MAKSKKECWELRCGCSLGKHKQLILLILLACVLATGVMLNILACALFDNGWWTFFVVIAYIGAPIPDILCARCKDEEDSGVSFDEESGWRSCCIKGWSDGAYFTTGFLLLSGLALPLVLAHNDVVGLPTMIMSLSGGLLVYGSVMGYLRFLRKQSDDDDEYIDSTEMQH
eukprot:CAMPEP_0201547722 /NCGR_PEP_ID=MMETSP0173_2-20130828/4225_1 /ASSEMBLY_ACC=CAM_ASM_000268 /TAXON_ID=218659 /ORGANISM="Vexillifera sp., Strain DIVA3 564/2" /LENGTH=169 /DNA_ID=CAMNT_0047956875 /DNA_START=16 /DNA_END=522 /DNA_ORIENTATION=-